MNHRILTSALLGTSLLMLSGCGIAKNYSDAEQEMVSTMTPSQYQPATRTKRANIETQDQLAQAAFWSREYQLNPTDLEAAVKLAAVVRKMGNASKAFEITQMTRAMHPNDPYLIAEHAAALIALERGNEALQPLDVALRGAPGYARLWSLKGAALDQTEKYDLARQHYTRALQITPNDPNIMANMGLSFALGGDPATAEQWLRRAMSHPQANAGIKQNLDLVMQLQGKSISQASVAPQTNRRLQPGQSQYGQPSSQAYAPASQPAPTFGHRSSRTVVGQQAGAPTSASEMARSIASNSSQNRVTVPHMPASQTPANILGQISQSVNQKRQVAQQAYQNRQAVPQSWGQPYPPQAQQPVQAQGQNGYPQSSQVYGTPQRRGAARTR